MKNLLRSKQSDNTFFQWVWNLENLWTGNCTSHWVKTWREVLHVFQVNQMLPLYHKGIICSDFQRRPANHWKLFVKTRLNWLVTLANSIYMWILILWDFKDWFINLTYLVSLLFELHLTDFKFGEKCLLSVINNNPYESKILKVKLFRSLIVLFFILCLFSLYHHAVMIKWEGGGGVGKLKQRCYMYPPQGAENSTRALQVGWSLFCL